MRLIGRTLCLLFSFIPSPAHPTTVSCSTRPTISDCSLVQQSTPTDNNGTIDWKTIRPFGLRTAFLLKTNAATHDLTTLSTIRWRLPLGVKPLPVPLEGFLITVSDLNQSSYQQYEALLSHPVLKLDRQLSDVEYYIDSDSLLQLGKRYRIEVTLMPLGLGGSTLQLRDMPSRPNRSECNFSTESSNLAKYWRVEFTSIDISLASADVRVAFLAAPEYLCIHRYLVSIVAANRSFSVEHVLNKTADPTQEIIFHNLPRESKLFVKVVPYSYAGEQCPCPGCSCITAKSEVFEIPPLLQKVFPTEAPLPTTDNTTDYGLMFLGLAGILLFMLGVFSIWSFVLLRQRINGSAISRLKNTETVSPLIIKPQSYRILVVGSPGSEEETSLIDNFARLLRNSVHSVKYNRFEPELVERNTHMWLKTAIVNADKIVMLKTRQAPTEPDMNFYSIVNSILPLHDDRTMFVKLHPNCDIMNPTAETVYLLGRDIRYMCSTFNVEFDDSWQRLLLDVELLYSERGRDKVVTVAEEDRMQSPSSCELSTMSYMDSGIGSTNDLSETSSSQKSEDQ